MICLMLNHAAFRRAFACETFCSREQATMPMNNLGLRRYFGNLLGIRLHRSCRCLFSNEMKKMRCWLYSLVVDFLRSDRDCYCHL